MSSLKEEQFKKKLDLEIKNYEIIKSSFTKIYETETTLYKAKMGVYDSISKLKEIEENKSLRNIYDTVCREMNELAAIRNSKILKIKSELAPATIYYTSKTKNYKNLIGKYHALPQNSLQNLSTSKNNIYIPGEDFDKDIGYYEMSRADANKQIFLFYIHYELEYHTKAVEKLTELYKMILNTMPKNDLIDFVEKYNFRQVNIEDYGYEEDKNKKKLTEGRIDEESENKNNINNKEEENNQVNDILNKNEIGSKTEDI